MSLKVTLEESPRIFEVKIGFNVVGRVTSYREVDCPDDEAYCAERLKDGGNEDTDADFVSVGWFGTLKKAGIAVVEHSYGYTKLDSIVERVV
jgi:hypothetical protein